MASFEDLSAGQGITTPSTSGSSSTVSYSLSDADLSYDNPFLDMTSTYIPTQLKTMFKFIASFLFGDPLVNQVVTKLSEYPITQLVYEAWETSLKTDDEPEKIWKNILEKCINVRKQLIVSGSNYYGYGNGYVSVHFPFTRMVRCVKCLAANDVNNFITGSLKFNKKKYTGKCPKCKATTDFEYYDNDVKDYSRVRMIHWDVMNVTVKFNNITGESFYYYTIPANINRAVSTGDLDIVNSTPKDVLRAIAANKKLKLKKGNFFHLKREQASYIYPSERGYGIPAVMPVMKSVVHNQILKKGNEMIAFEHIVPLRIMFPMASGEISPHVTTDLGTWKTKVDNSIKAWRKDKNKIMTVPLPVGIQNLGGDAKALMVTPEVKATEENIITGMGMIPEIVRGGASWSGSNVSLRVIENSFLNHRSDMEALLEFVVDQIAVKYDLPKIKVTLSEFKMADDLQRKQLIINAARGTASESILSRETAIKELGFEPAEEYKNKQAELKEILDLRVQDAQGDARARGEASILDAVFGAEAEVEHQNKIQSGQRDANEKRVIADKQKSQENADAVSGEVSALANVAGVKSREISMPDLILRLTERFAILSRSNSEEFKMRMLNMKTSTPALYEEVYNNLRELNLIQADLKPDLAVAQEQTPGELPVYTQGEAAAQAPASPAEAGANPGVAGDKTGESDNSETDTRPNPEAKPPRRVTATI